MVGRGEQCEIQVRYVRPKGTEIKYGFQNADEDVSCALVADRNYNDKNILNNTTLQVNSPHLLEIFKSTVSYYPTVPVNFDVPFEMESPFQMFFHYWDELHAVHDKNDLSDEARMHLKLLLEFMRLELGPSKERVESMLKTSSIGFSTLWTIFRPGCLVYTELDAHPWLLRLEKTAYEENVKMGKWMEVHCTYTDYDGENYGQANHVIKIYQKRLFAAENPCKITRLPAFPLAWLEGREELEERLAERGTRFLGIQGIHVRSYNGLARYLKEPPWDFYDPDMSDFPGVWLPHTETGRVVLDQRTFQEENYSEGVALSSRSVSERSERMLCPPYTHGYSLARKDWCRFYIDCLSDIEWNRSALDILVLTERRKSVLEALVFSHAFPDLVRDEMKQKGKGLVILLHGSPGSGKTLTAECVAEATGKALLTATMGELNQDDIPSRFESRLKQVLQYATIWKAIVLLDEADVFLEGRSEAVGVAKEHNAFVAVFLKHLEYFSGIVFLTSNRVRVFDKAMKSRIHLALEYQPPNIDMRRRIWTHCLSAIPASELDLDVEEDVDDFLKEEVNGREIANCVTTARTLARFKRVKLQSKHIETVLETRREFEKSLHNIRERWQQADPVGSGPFQIARRDTFAMADD